MSSDIKLTPSTQVGEGWGEGEAVKVADDIAIRVSNLSRLKQSLYSRLQRLIGRNGLGKSTLLMAVSALN
jgi:ABC-type branched-subunit amino acid transport system ATPase component